MGGCLFPFFSHLLLGPRLQRAQTLMSRSTCSAHTTHRSCLSCTGYEAMKIRKISFSCHILLIKNSWCSHVLLVKSNQTLEPSKKQYQNPISIKTTENKFKKLSHYKLKLNWSPDFFQASHAEKRWHISSKTDYAVSFHLRFVAGLNKRRPINARAGLLSQTFSSQIK